MKVSSGPEVEKIRLTMIEISKIFEKEDLSGPEITNILFNLFIKASVINIEMGLTNFSDFEDCLVNLKAAVAFELERNKKN